MLGDWFHSGSTLQFDAAHYAAIAHEGYVPFRQAFFPFLPTVWRTLHFGNGGICLFNCLVYLLSTTWIACRLKVSLKPLLLFLTLPSTIFFFVPYTESLFFAFSSLIILGMMERSVWKVLLGLLLCSLTRPTFTTLLPAVVLAIILSKPIKAARGTLITLCILSCAMGLYLVATIQHSDTGEWLGFYSAQKGWGNELRWPSVPLGSWGGDDVVRLDAVALLFGLASLYILFQQGMSWIKTRRTDLSPALIVSMASLAFVALLVFVLRGGQLFSLNRFIFCTPFCLVFLSHITERNTLVGLKPLAAILLILEAYFAFFGSMVHIQNLLKFTLVVAYLMLAVVATSSGSNLQRWAYPLLIAVAFGLQVSFALKFLSGGWVA